MKLSTGVDLIEIERVRSAIDAHGERFLHRIFTSRELAALGGKVESLAGRFAAKEATAKALGCGIGDITWKEIEILRGDLGQPELILHGEADRLAKKLGLANWSISLSHSQGHAIAMVVAIG
jgi:holo-[acyl-carrier protein] synthase